MPIRYDPSSMRFLLSTRHTLYAFDVWKGRYLRHLYYGKKTRNVPTPPPTVVSFSPYIRELTAENSPNELPQEMSFFGSGDFRAEGLRLCGSDGTGVTDFVYESYRILSGRVCPEGLPSARADADTRTLEITLSDAVTGCSLLLCYTVFPNSDVITRHLTLVNNSGAPVRIETCMPLVLDIPRSDLDMITLCGAYGRECELQRFPLHRGSQSVGSRRGASSHFANPFFALCDHRATEERGEAYGFNFVFSGSFESRVEVDHRGQTRVLEGLGSECFSYTVEPGESFDSPEAVLTYSAAGLGGMRRNLHRFIRAHILPPSAREPHPVVLNTWEAVWFGVDQELLLRFAETAAPIGFDMVVMDDGWFGARDHDRAGLGDWYPNPKKFHHGLHPFADGIHATGQKLGIWIEPEMVNPDSELYRTHPDWCLRVDGREAPESRNQLVLDMANPEVLAYLKDSFSRVFDGVEIDYFKWDMNRNLACVGSAALPPERQGEVCFRYVKGVYELLRWFGEHFPNAVIETCSGGGGRYDLGMMQYGIQIWTSDNTDPYARARIQAGALLGYPAATMSCHVSNPHGSLASLDFRYKVAVGGMLGYELNILDMSPEIKAEIARQIREYHRFEHLIREGDCYEPASPLRYPYAVYCYAAPNGEELLLSLIETAGCPAGKTKRLRVRAALPGVTYIDRLSGRCFDGDELRAGISLTCTGEPNSAQLYHLTVKHSEEKQSSSHRPST